MAEKKLPAQTDKKPVKPVEKKLAAMAKAKSEKGDKNKENFFVRAGKRIAKWFREMKSELKKVVWPTKKQTLNNTIVACVVMVVAGVVLWAFDQLAMVIVNALISIGA